MQEFEEYEFQICDYHRITTNDSVWHWKYIPEEHLFASGFITNYNIHRLKRKERLQEEPNNIREYGLDGLSLNSDGIYNGLQAKCWNPKKYLTASDLGSFLAVIFTRLMTRNPLSCGYLYHTCRIQADVKDSFKHHPNLISKLLLFNKIEETQIIGSEKDFELYPPQKDALIALKNGWENCGLVSMPCALGKTVLLGNYLRDVQPKHVIILSPLRVLTKQILDRINPFIPEKECVLVDSDEGGTTNIEDVKKVLENPCLISITYESFLNIFVESGEIEIEDALIVVDEAHNLIQYSEIMDYLNDLSEKSLLLTATPSETMMEYLNCDIIYEYLMSEAIRENYICDYLINVPVLDLVDNRVDIDIPDELKHLNSDLTMKCLFLLSGMLETGSRRCIIYCCSIEECEVFNEIFSDISRNYHGIQCWSNSITANTNITNRNEILNNFQNNEAKISILSSVRILNEGVNIVKCDSVFITKVNDNEIVAVQRMCRANRKDRENPCKIANCFIWADDLDKTVEMLQFLKTNDESRFYNKIVARNGNYERKGEATEIKKDIDYTKTLKEYISVRSMNYEDIWKMKLENVRKYIFENNKLPSKHDKNKSIKTLGIWVITQKQNYAKKEKIMKTPEIRKLWEEFIEKYSKYFLNNEEQWEITLKVVRKYIDENNKLPSTTDKNASIKKLGKWLSKQKTNYAKKEKIMKSPEIRKLWEKFQEKYSEYFISNNEQWENTLKIISEHVDENNNLPSTHDKDESIKKLGSWIGTQKNNYSKEKEIMKSPKIRKLWEKFQEKYSEYFISNEEQWKITLKLISEYVDENKKLPSQYDKTESIKKLGQWIQNQKTKYSKKEHIMKTSPEICKLWEKFQEKYSEYFISNEEKWENTLKLIEEYVDENKKFPSKHDKNESIKKLGQWLLIQKQNYAKKEQIMKTPEIHKLWVEFQKKYSEYFISNEEQWKNNFQKVNEYIDKNNKLPSENDKNDSIKKLSIWIQNQKKKYGKKEFIMKNLEISKLWEEFQKKYSKY
jgi:superfamily II DNA or RNA helicase